MFYRCFSRVQEWQHAGMMQVTRQVLHLRWSVLNGVFLASAASVAWLAHELFLLSMSSLFCSALPNAALQTQAVRYLRWYCLTD